jgi:hypothetical protein
MLWLFIKSEVTYISFVIRSLPQSCIMSYMNPLHILTPCLIKVLNSEIVEDDVLFGLNFYSKALFMYVCT